MSTTEQIGEIKIRLPDENSKEFYIFQDLADLFGLEYQSDAVCALRKKLKSIILKPKPSIDYEADNVSIRTTSADIIFETAKIINDLSIQNFKIDNNKKWIELHNNLKSWKRPRPQDWKVGDLFTFKIKTNCFVFGQIIGPFPTCALFDIKSQTDSISENEIKKAKVITILHLLPNRLNDFSWKILRNLDVLASKNSGPWGSDKVSIGHKSATPGYLEEVAKYYWFGEHNWKDEKALKALIIKDKGFLKRIFRKK